MNFVEARAPVSVPRSVNRSATQAPLSRNSRENADVSVVFAQTSGRRVDLFERLSVRNIWGNDFTITHIMRRSAGHGMTDVAARRESHVACVHLEKLASCDIWCDDEQQTPRTIEAGSVHINDMRRAWRADIKSSFDVVNFCIPQAAFDEITTEQGSAPVSELH